MQGYFYKLAPPNSKENKRYFVLNAIYKFLSGLTASLHHTPPKSQIVRIKGTMPPDGSHPPKFDQILLVDDIPRNTQASLDTIRKRYEDNELTVHITHTFAEALAAFNLYDIKLVILDLDLNDSQGDGATLQKEFREKKPEIIVLANSSEQKYNDILVKGGANAVLAKDARKLKRWLAKNG